MLRNNNVYRTCRLGYAALNPTKTAADLKG